jgi:hypothetical protein
MSYDVHVIRFRDGEVVAGASPQAWRLLESAWESPPDEFKYCRVRRGEDEGDVYGLEPGKPIEGLMSITRGRASTS